MRRTSDDGIVPRKTWPAQLRIPAQRLHATLKPLTTLLSHWLAAAQETHTSCLKAEADPETGGYQLTQQLKAGSILKGDLSHVHQ